MRRLTIAILLSAVFFLPAFAQDDLGSVQGESVIHAFITETCPHCRDFKEFLDGWEGAPGATFYEVADRGSYEVFQKLQDRMPSLTGSVPTIYINGEVIQGFNKKTGGLIQSIYEECSASSEGCTDFSDFLNPSAIDHGNGDDPVTPPPGDNPEDAMIHAFVVDSCPFCRRFKTFVENWGGNLGVTYYNVDDIASEALFEKVKERMPTIVDGVPTIILNGEVFQGYESDETTGEDIKKIIEECASSDGGCISFESFLDGQGANEPFLFVPSNCIEDPTTQCEAPDDEDEKFVFNLWFFGETDLRTLSLPALSLILGGLDGFNPCAMWVLITLLALLINTRSWPKILAIGGIFLFVSGFMYYIFMAAWLNAFLFIGFNQWVQKIIGLVAIGGGAFYLYEAFGKNPNECKVTNLSARQKVIERMKKVIAVSSWPLMIVGVTVLAFSVNLIELVCTAGLPAIFTAILAQNDLSTLAHYWYILLYILAYMFDDFVVYIVAIATLHASGLTTKYRRLTLIFGGALMATLGILLIFYPQALMFG